MLTPELTLPIVISAALLDSINPCVFGVLIFLIAFMTKVFKSPTRMLLGGLTYSLVVYITYLLIGLGFLKFTVSFGVSIAVYWIAATIAILAGLVEIKDFFWYGRGFSLQMIPGAAQRIKYFTKNRKIMRGIYEHDKSDTGGPFFVYIFDTDRTNEVILVSGFINFPGHEKLLLLRQLEIMAKTLHKGDPA